MESKPQSVANQSQVDRSRQPTLKSSARPPTNPSVQGKSHTKSPVLDASVSKKSANLGEGHDITKDKSIDISGTKKSFINKSRSKSQIKEGSAKSQIDISILTAINNADYLLQSLILLKGKQHEFTSGELIGLTKMTVTQIIILKGPSFRAGLDPSGKDPMEYVPEESRKLIDQYMNQLGHLDPIITKRYTQCIKNPILFIQLLIKELVEDSTFVLGIDSLPDESGFRAKEDELNQISMQAEEEKLVDQGSHKSVQYSYGKDLVWKYKILRLVL